MSSQYGDDEDVALSLSPLIDAVFLLLIFFLVSAMLKKDDRTVEDISLPLSTSSLEMKPDDEQVVVNIDKEGDLYYMGDPTTVNLLHAEIKQLALEDPNASVRIDTDEKTPFHRVVQVLDILSFRDMQNVGIRTYHEKYD